MLPQASAFDRLEGDAHKSAESTPYCLGQGFSLFDFVGYRKNKCAKLRIAKTGLKNLKKRGGK